MKKRNLIILIIGLIAVGLAIVACGKDSESSSEAAAKESDMLVWQQYADEPITFDWYIKLFKNEIIISSLTVLSPFNIYSG